MLKGKEYGYSFCGAHIVSVPIFEEVQVNYRRTSKVSAVTLQKRSTICHKH